jgi:hypothetical protein
MLIATTRITSVRLGNTTIHQLPENSCAYSKRISVPSEGWFKGTPTPRKESVASPIIAKAKSRVASTRSGVDNT